MEELVKYYYDDLQTAKQPGYVIARFFCEFFSLEFNTGYVKSFAKLVTLYGRNEVFRAVLDISAKLDVTALDNVYALIAYICRERLEKKPVKVNNSLQELVKEREERLHKLEKNQLIIRSPFDDEYSN